MSQKPKTIVLHNYILNKINYEFIIHRINSKVQVEM